LTDDIFSPALAELEEKGLLRHAVAFEECDGRTVTRNGKRYLLFCSNDYLGLSHDRRVKDAVKEAVERYGFGSGGSRLISGTRPPHEMLESGLKDFLGASAAILFNSGYCANSGIIPAIAGKGDAILADRLNHASLVDGCLLSRAEFLRYPHRDMKGLEKLLLKTSSAKNRWIITDGLFSMDGDIAPLDEICGLARTHDARVYVDDAHAFGVLGEGGRGTPALFGVEGGIDLLVGTLGKAAGGMGAFATGSASTIDFLLNRTRSFIFSTAMPPAVAAGNLKAVEILAGCREERKEFLGITSSFHTELKKLDIAMSAESYIMPVVVGGSKESLDAAKAFWDEGVYLQAVRPPAVPEGTARLRLTLSMAQRGEDRIVVLNAMKKIIRR